MSDRLLPGRERTTDRDLSRRAMYGGLVYFGFLVALVITTDYTRIRPSMIGLISACSVLCAAGRLLLALHFDRIYDYSRLLWQALMWFCVTLTAVAWGLFLAATVLLFGYNDEKTLILLIGLAGTAPVALTSFAPSLHLTLTYQLLICTPMIFANILLGGLGNYTLAALFSWYLVFMVIVARRLHWEYQESLDRSEMLSAKRAAEEASRAKSDLLAYISHEIRGPMNAISGMTYLALDSAKEQQQREYLEIVHDSSRFLERLLNGLLEMSRLDAGKRSLECLPLDLHRLVQHVSISYRAAAEGKGLTFHAEISQDVPRLLTGDAGALRQILQNIVANAVRFTERGRIDIAVTVVEVDEKTITLQFSVTDTGVGIPQERQRAIFEPFQQADVSVLRRFGGSGLGLTICSRLVALMGGTLTVTSEPGAGSTFRWTVRLQHADPPDQPVATDSDVTAAVEKRVRILVADDEAVSRLVTTRLLERRGHVVSTAANGYEVLAAVSRERFELILMDLHMPELDGLAAAARIRKGEPESSFGLPIIALTAEASAGMREQCMSAGMNGFLTKPIDPVELYRLVEEYTAVPGGKRTATNGV